MNKYYVTVWVPGTVGRADHRGEVEVDAVSRMYASIEAQRRVAERLRVDVCEVDVVRVERAGEGL